MRGAMPITSLSTTCVRHATMRICAVRASISRPTRSCFRARWTMRSRWSPLQPRRVSTLPSCRTSVSCRCCAVNCPELELHASTQLNVRGKRGIELATRLGCSRVTLARELSIEQIARLAELGVDLEVFVHGALCICQSGQCLLSSLIGGRSANRGLCAQPCRLPYKLVDEDGKTLAQEGQYLLSPKDLCGIGMVDRLIEADVASLKIEGRMKSPEYVSTVTATYREAIDRAWEDRASYEAADDAEDVLAEAFNRGFTQGYLAGERGNDMMGLPASEQSRCGGRARHGVFRWQGQACRDEGHRRG